MTTNWSIVADHPMLFHQLAPLAPAYTLPLKPHATRRAMISDHHKSIISYIERLKDTFDDYL